ncbi:hypothetical protein PSQ20_00645 [Curvibacter sp. RS43]|jgi:hypothetical protein|uniref:Uncharacterized protein n=1 Tax=Curvibacter microcysteis TaxID=3026419 RepID=A0ABT5MH83_9BURK|nr:MULTISPECIES: hypothetical protein [unclassified Curvibacter]MDD0808832.1 hypothetical protein [Curvibacter sp. RS43]MDD0815344.1 hypothetical protein [Curvibacter sp. HBC28]
MPRPLTSDEMLSLPNTVLYDPVAKRGAAYNGLHKLITESASSKLLEFALKKAYQDAPWDPTTHDPEGDWTPLPSWMVGEVQHRCVLYWLKSGDESDEDLLKIPAA